MIVVSWVPFWRCSLPIFLSFREHLVVLAVGPIDAPVSFAQGTGLGGGFEGSVAKFTVIARDR